MLQWGRLWERDVKKVSKEIIETGKTIEIAVKTACEKLGVSEDDVNIEILEKPKRILLGFKSTPAKVRVSVDMTKADYAKDFVKTIITEMGAVDADIVSEETDNSVQMTIEGDDLGFLIGKHGETLDAIQYITGLVVNQMESGYFRINLDCGNFREKREQSLIDLAKKLASQVLKTGRNVTLEPMNPYERRIIHATCQSINDVTSASVGVEPTRCVVISCTNPAIAKRRYSNNDSRSSGRGQSSRGNSGRYNKNKKSGGYSSSYDKRGASGGRYSGSKSYSKSYDRSYSKSSTGNDVEISSAKRTEPISDKDHVGELYGKIDL